MTFAARPFTSITPSTAPTRTRWPPRSPGRSIRDVYYAQARNYAGARAMALFPDQVPESVYDNLVAAVRRNLPAVHRYFQLRRRKLEAGGHPSLRHLRADRRRHDGAPHLGRGGRAGDRRPRPARRRVLRRPRRGLRGRWCDRYENKGKQSGAFSSGCYDSDPYILMNYQPDVLDHVFTLAHEAGHSMHSWHSDQAPAVPVRRLHDLRRRGGQHVQRATARAGTCWPTRSPTASGPITLNREIDVVRAHDRPADDVRRVREDRPRPRPSAASR